jgi:hypothetical protein
MYNDIRKHGWLYKRDDIAVSWANQKISLYALTVNIVNFRRDIPRLPAAPKLLAITDIICCKY